MGASLNDMPQKSMSILHLIVIPRRRHGLFLKPKGMSEAELAVLDNLLPLWQLIKDVRAGRYDRIEEAAQGYV